MIFLFAAAGICLPSFPGGYLHPRKSKIVIPKMVTFQARRSFFFGRAHHFEGPDAEPYRSNFAGFNNTPRFDSRIEPEAMMIWFRWFSELPLKSILRFQVPFIFQGCLKRIFFVVCSGRPTLENTSCMWRSIASSKPWAIFLKSVPFREEQKLRKSEKNPGFFSAAIFLVVRKWITWNKKRAVPKGNGRKRNKKNGRHEERTVDLVRKRFFEGW